MWSIVVTLSRVSSEKPRTIAGAWIESRAAAGLSKAEALRQLNAALGTHYRQSRLYEWIAGIYSPERPVRLYMLRQALPHILRTTGVDISALTPKQIERLAERLA